MNYCILRTAKLKSIGEVMGSARHTFREIRTPNADKKRTHLNATIGAQSSLALARAVNARLPEKRRRDAVICLEYLITASPEWWDKASTKQKNAYLQASMDWLKARHGADNVVCLNLQLDEKTPHLVAYIVPLTKDGRLSAAEFIGSPAKLTAMQTAFAKDVGARFGLQRGIEGSRATHTTVKQFYGALLKNPTLSPPKPPAPTMVDRLTGKAAEMEAEHQAKQVKHVALVEQARNVALVNQSAREAQARAIEEQRRRTVKLEAEKEEAERIAAEAKARSDRLAKENRRLREQAERQVQAFAVERSQFQEVIAGLKDKLVNAMSEIKRLAARVLFLEGLFLPKRDSEFVAHDRENRPIIRP